MWGRGRPYELPPSCGSPCSIENILFLKPRETHSSLYHQFQLAEYLALKHLNFLLRGHKLNSLHVFGVR